MPLRLKISCHSDDGWSVEGLPGRPCRRFRDLHEALDWAEQACSSAPADIEIWMDGFYIVIVSQEAGWPRQICSTGARWRPVLQGRADNDKQPGLTTRLAARLAHWFQCVAASASPYSKGAVICHSASVLFAHRHPAVLPGKHRRTTAPPG